MNFEFYTASKIVFGPGELNRVGDIAKEMGDSALLVLGGGSLKKAGIVDRLVEL